MMEDKALEPVTSGPEATAAPTLVDEVRGVIGQGPTSEKRLVKALLKLLTASRIPAPQAEEIQEVARILEVCPSFPSIALSLVLASPREDRTKKSKGPKTQSLKLLSQITPLLRTAAARRIQFPVRFAEDSTPEEIARIREEWLRDALARGQSWDWLQCLSATLSKPYVSLSEAALLAEALTAVQNPSPRSHPTAPPPVPPAQGADHTAPLGRVDLSGSEPSTSIATPSYSRPQRRPEQQPPEGQVVATIARLVSTGRPSQPVTAVVRAVSAFYQTRTHRVENELSTLRERVRLLAAENTAAQADRTRQSSLREEAEQRALELERQAMATQQRLLQADGIKSRMRDQHGEELQLLATREREALRRRLEHALSEARRALSREEPNVAMALVRVGEAEELLRGEQH